MPNQTGGQDDLAAGLSRWRDKSGKTGQQAADVIGKRQPSISRYEAGKFVPEPDDVAALLRFYGAPATVRRRLVQIARDLRENTNPPVRVVMSRGVGKMQQRIGRIEASSKVIRSFCPTFVIGLLQTPEYVRAVFSSGGDLSESQVQEGVDARLIRQELLTDPSREFVLVMTEGSLLWQIGGPALMVEQITHIERVSQLPNVRVGIIPWTTVVSVTPTHAFDVHDERAAIVGTEVATAFMTNPHDVGALAKLFTELEALASFGEDARGVLDRLRAGYATLL